MSAGIIVITGGILAGVILLCIVAVLCYCRLQHYCCKKNDSEQDVVSGLGPDPLSHFPCEACNALAMDGATISPVSLDQLGSSHDRCPTCSPYPLRSGLSLDDVCNGGERLGFHTYYENPSANTRNSSPLSFYSPSDMMASLPRPYSTQV
ncbi:protein FAM163A-like [Cynoglossus semilaevis]|uniref:protein FAM163A-like n=1 Tax=Cynoglossus semilaevis TaxID=244447 RepID=UPI0004971CEE|nr:protein FAM163A-like [Cynoglossus semilaevis]